MPRIRRARVGAGQVFRLAWLGTRRLRAAWPAFTASCGVLVKRPDWKEPCTIARQVNADSDKAIRLFFETFLCRIRSSLPMAPVRACYGLLRAAAAWRAQAWRTIPDAAV
jgi:hypothetical protein